MIAVNRHSCPHLCSLNDKGDVYYDIVKLPWHVFKIGPNMNMYLILLLKQ
jgi:hypothetical protein